MSRLLRSQTPPHWAGTPGTWPRRFESFAETMHATDTPRPMPAHNTATCPACGPYVNTPAWARGEARAKALNPPRVVSETPAAPTTVGTGLEATAPSVDPAW